MSCQICHVHEFWKDQSQIWRLNAAEVLPGCKFVSFLLNFREGGMNYSRSPLVPWYTYPLKAGHAVTTSWITHTLPNFLMLLDALTNTYLGSRRSKDGDKAEAIPKWGNNLLDEAWYWRFFTTLKFCPIYFLPLGYWLTPVNSTSGERRDYKRSFARLAQVEMQGPRACVAEL